MIAIFDNKAINECKHNVLTTMNVLLRWISAVTLATKYTT